MDKYISISDMAKLHGITRQTLIYYDNIDLFKPVRVDSNGYRYYSPYQIPYLREICFLRSMDISIKEILDHFTERTPKKEKELLEKQKDYIINKIAKLNQIRTYLTEKINYYQEAVEAHSMNLNIPFEKYIGPRRIVFSEYYKPIDKEKLHLTLMSLWRHLIENKVMHAYGFGSLIAKDDVENLERAGSFIFLPYNKEFALPTRELPAGLHICMYKYGMPYDNQHIKILLQWIEEHNYKVCGDIVDICLLDTTFYQQDTKSDFCVLQVPVEKLA